MWFNADTTAEGVQALRQYRTAYDEKLKTFADTRLAETRRRTSPTPPGTMSPQRYRLRAKNINRIQPCGRTFMSAKIFLSTVSDEFRAYRDQLRSDLTWHNVEVKVQEDFKDLGRGTLDELDVYIADCDAVVHLAGHMTGKAPREPTLRALRAKYPDLADKLPPLGEALRNGSGVSYTHWEAWLALYRVAPRRQ